MARWDGWELWELLMIRLSFPDTSEFFSILMQGACADDSVWPPFSILMGGII